MISLSANSKSPVVLNVYTTHVYINMQFRNGKFKQTYVQIKPVQTYSGKL